MAGAGDLVEHHTRHLHTRIMRGKTACDGGSGLRLAGDVEHQQHRDAEMPGKIRRRPTAAWGGVHAVEQPHRGFDQHNLRIGEGVGGQGVEQRRGHRPRIQIHPRHAGCGGMEGGVDIVGTRLARTHGNPAPTQGREQAQGDGGFAAA